MSQRTCVKCRLHGKISILRGHKRNCLYAHCCCNKCASYENTKGKREELGNKTTAASNVESSKIESFPEMVQKEIMTLANIENETKTLEKGRSEAEKRQEKRRKRLEQHQTFYSNVNSFSSSIIKAQPGLSPLQVLRASIQMSQKKSPCGESREEVLMSPDLPRKKAAMTQNAPSDSDRLMMNVKRLKDVLPNTDEEYLVDTLLRTGNNIEAAIDNIFSSSSPENPPKIDLESGDTATSSFVALCEMEEKEKMANISSLNVDCSLLKAILQNVKTNENKRGSKENKFQSTLKQNYISFHKEMSNIVTPKILNEKSIALSSQITSCPPLTSCNSCGQNIQRTDNFCSSCGKLVKKGYERY